MSRAGTVVIERCRGWQIASRPAARVQRDKPKFLAWAKMGPITGTGPLDEPGFNVWFNFGRTREEAVATVKREIGIS
jgi:hypothetical protein